MIYVFTLGQDLQSIINTNSQVSCMLLLLIKSLPQSRYKLFNQIRGRSAYIACRYRLERRHDEFLLLDHALLSPLVACKQSPRGLFLLLLELGLELLAALLRYLVILSIDNVFGVDLRCIYHITGHGCR